MRLHILIAVVASAFKLKGQGQRVRGLVGIKASGKISSEVSQSAFWADQIRL
jgi:hypothetical protein